MKRALPATAAIILAALSTLTFAAPGHVATDPPRTVFVETAPTAEVSHSTASGAHSSDNDAPRLPSTIRWLRAV